MLPFQSEFAGGPAPSLLLARNPIRRMRNARVKLSLLLLAAMTVIAARHPVGQEAIDDHQVGQHGHPDGSGPGLYVLQSGTNEGLINPSNEVPVPAVKGPTKGFAAAIRAKERCIRASISGYARAARSVALALRQSEIIFPFHCFW